MQSAFNREVPLYVCCTLHMHMYMCVCSHCIYTHTYVCTFTFAFTYVCTCVFMQKEESDMQTKPGVRKLLYAAEFDAFIIIV